MKVVTFQHGINALTISHRKEKKYTKSICFVDRESIEKKVEARIYWTDSRCYCCIWIQHPQAWVSSSGYAGGWGYHKESAALADALRNAGIELSEDISGRGEYAMDEAILALGRHCGFEGNIIKTHG